MKNIFQVLAGLALSVVAAASLAAGFPDRSVTIVVPFPAGGTTDVLARQLGKGLADKWGVPVVVDNKSGASGTIGSAYVARNKGDGYTLLLTATHHVINPTLLKDTIAYDTKSSFTSLALVATVPNVLVVNKNFAPKTVSELIALAKSKPGEINFGSAGIGGANHLSGELFAHEAGIKLTHIPYRGAAPSLSDLLAGQIPMMFDSLPGVMAHIESGQLRALGVTTSSRVAQLPNVPTIAEEGLKGFEATAWFGLYGPKDMPADIVANISKDVDQVLASDELKKSFAGLGATPGQMTQPEFAKFVDAEMTKWGKVIEAANISVK
jgi:tripartite-type tricarboxylate transporter receptor subunit TctC